MQIPRRYKRTVRLYAWLKQKKVHKKKYISGGSSIGRTRRTPPPPVIGENIAFSCIFLNKVKLTTLFFSQNVAYAPSFCTFWIRHWIWIHKHKNIAVRFCKCLDLLCKEMILKGNWRKSVRIRRIPVTPWTSQRSLSRNLKNKSTFSSEG